MILIDKVPNEVKQQQFVIILSPTLTQLCGSAIPVKSNSFWLKVGASLNLRGQQQLFIGVSLCTGPIVNGRSARL